MSSSKDPKSASQASRQSYLMAGLWIFSIVDGKFEYSWQVEITAEPVSFGAESTGFHAAGSSAPASIQQVFALLQ